jgi:hypothetical protein
LFGKVFGCLALFLVLITSISLGAIGLTMHAPDLGDCGEGWPDYKPNPDYPVFVARVIHSNPLLGSVAVIQEHFWNLRHDLRVVFLKVYARPGEVYFVSGRLSSGLLTRWIFPVINMHCSRSDLIQYAGVDLRVLRGGVPKPGVRLIGKAVRRGNYHEVIPGVKVEISGPSGTVLTQTDRQGIYDVAGLPPGHYRIRADVYSNAFRAYPSCPDFIAVQHLQSGDVWGCTLKIDLPSH